VDSLHEVIKALEQSPNNVSFEDLCNICEAFFGKPRNKGSHKIYKIPWQGDPRINIQKSENGKAKAYQVRQVIKALKRLEGEKW